jgi:hypothetical protein
MSDHSYEPDEYEVNIHLKPTSREITHMAVNTYEKGSFYCIEQPDGTCVKYPTSDIWRIRQDMK